MAFFKCKMCGGTLELGNESVGVCEYCGTRQTLPRLDSERKAALYDRASHFRANNDFDKAAGIYEQILGEDNRDAEAYWSLVLCRFGIEYVEDPASRRRIPTVNRTQLTSVFDDENYRAALHYADMAQREIYEQEAQAINSIQKGILAISQREDPFDVFICYKETDAAGRRTLDSVLAQDLYTQLTQNGFKVFFSRITLEDKLGTAYEPYIFAALNSAKVMVVLGTRPEHFQAVWVKNEWSRYLAMIRGGAQKVLIPAYRDMDPYSLPEEFSHLQAQDMSKLGFMQDLIRGIQKIISGSAEGKASVAPLLKRVHIFLEDGDWRSADEYCEKVLDIDPENAQAYLGKLMAQQQVNRPVGLAYCAVPFDNSNYYHKVVRYGDPRLVSEINSYLEAARKNGGQPQPVPVAPPQPMLQAPAKRPKWILPAVIAGVLVAVAAVILTMPADREPETEPTHKHLWQDASCQTPRTCTECGQTRGTALEHSWQAATYQLPQTCTECGQTQGQSLSQQWKKEPLKTQTGIIAVTPGGWSTYALTEGGRVYALGRNQDGQNNVGPWSNITVISGGDRHVAALRADGTVEAIGCWNSGQCDVSDWQNMIDVCAGVYCTVGICADGTVRVAGQSPDAWFDVSLWRDIVRVAAGDHHIVGLRCDGTVVSTGQNTWGQCEVSGWTDIVAVAADEFHTLGLRADGTVVAAGRNKVGACDVQNWTDIVAVAAGAGFSVGLRSDGTVVTAGDFTDKNKLRLRGTIDTPTTWTNVVQIAARYNQIFGLTRDGTIVACGYNAYGQCDVYDLQTAASGVSP